MLSMWGSTFLLLATATIGSSFLPALAQAPKKTDTALLTAIESEHSKRAVILIRHGADVNTKDKDGFTPLILAARYGSVPLVRSLLDKKADVNAKSFVYNSTPLIFAAERGNETIVKLLLHHGADINFRDADGSTALMSARREHHPRIVGLLKRAGARDTPDDLHPDPV